MKTIKILLFLIGMISFHSGYSQAKAKVYFIRYTGLMASAVSFPVFIDKKMFCKLKNNRFSIHETDEGEHIFLVQYSGTRPKLKAKALKIDVVGGKTYYIEIVYLSKILVNNVFCREVTKEEAEIILKKCVEEKKCI